jgi:hypothetical protein
MDRIWWALGLALLVGLSWNAGSPAETIGELIGFLIGLFLTVYGILYFIDRIRNRGKSSDDKRS